MNRFVRIFFLLGVGLTVSFVEAVYKMGEKKPLRVRNNNGLSTSRSTSSSRADTKRDEFPILEGLSKRYSVGVDQLQYFRSIHHGYEEIVPALVIAREAQVEVGRLLSDRMKGKSWKDIAETFSLDLKPLNQEVLQILKPIREVLPKEVLSERPQPFSQEKKGTQ